MKFYPTKRGRKMFSRAEGGGGSTKSFEVVLTWELEVLAIVMGGGGAKGYHPLKGGGGAQKVLPCLEGGGRKKFYPVLRGVEQKKGGGKSFGRAEWGGGTQQVLR